MNWTELELKWIEDNRDYINSKDFESWFRNVDNYGAKNSDWRSARRLALLIAYISGKIICLVERSPDPLSSLKVNLYISGGNLKVSKRVGYFTMNQTSDSGTIEARLKDYLLGHQLPLGIVEKLLKEIELGVL